MRARVHPRTQAHPYPGAPARHPGEIDPGEIDPEKWTPEK